MVGMTCASFDELLNQMRSASFGGVTFHVDSTSEDYGHRVIVHEFPFSDQHHTESLGRKARKIGIEGYFVGDSWLSQRDRMIEIAEGGEIRTLRHPFYSRFIFAKCISFGVNETKEELGMVRFSMELVEEFSIDLPSPREFVLYNIRNALDSFLGAAFDSFYRSTSIRLFDDIVRTTTIGGIEKWAGIIELSRILTPMRGGSSVGSVVERLFSNSDRFADHASTATGEFGISEGAVSPNPYALGDELTNVITNWRADMIDPDRSIEALAEGIYEGINVKPVISGSVSRRRAREAEVEVDRVFRRAVGGLWAEITASKDYKGRREAVVARNNLVRWLDSEAVHIDPAKEPQVYEEFDRYRARLMEEINRKFSDSAPIANVRSDRQLSAVALAYRIYGDPDRAQELWQRNPSPSPSLIGPDIEFLAR